MSKPQLSFRVPKQLREDIEQIQEERGIDEVKAMREAGRLGELQQAIDHIRIVTTSPAIDDLERLCREHQADIVVVDPLEKLEGKGSTNASMEAAMREIKDIARRTGIVFFITNHIRKAGQNKRQVDIWDSKGRKAITEESNFVFGFNGTEGSNRRGLQLLRSTHNVEVNCALEGNPDTFEFWTADRAETHAGTDTLSTDDLPS